MNVVVILTATGGFFGLLFALARHVERTPADAGGGRFGGLIYALSLAVYCTSWTFYGSVGRAAGSGINYLAVYAGPVALFLFGRPLLLRIVTVAKAHHCTSIADFLAARYGRGRVLPGLVAVIAVIGIMPYISLQLKAISASFGMLSHYPRLVTPVALAGAPVWADPVFYLTIVLAAFCWLFGTRHLDAGEQHRGLVSAIAAESVVKLLAFLAAGAFVVWGMHDGFDALMDEVGRSPQIASLFEVRAPLADISWWSVALASAATMVCLPRQFQVLVVENNSTSHLTTASWLFPLYLVAINLFVLPIAAAGLLTFGAEAGNADTFVLSLPIVGGQPALALFVFVGGLSAATAMVLVETIALATMIGNDLVMPIMLERMIASDPHSVQARIKAIRRGAIVGVLTLAYFYLRAIGDSYTLVNIGLMSFAAAAQFAPVILGGLFWQRAGKVAAVTGLAAGFAMWCYTLLLPSFSHSGWLPPAFHENGPFGLGLLAPHALFGIHALDPFTHGLLWSLAVNIGAYLTLSLLLTPDEAEHRMAVAFRGDGLSDTPATASLTIATLQALVGRFAGRARTQRAFAEFLAGSGRRSDPDAKAEADLWAYAERFLTGAIGAASARMVLATTQGNRPTHAATPSPFAHPNLDTDRGVLVDALDHLGQGVLVVDAGLRLSASNVSFQEMFGLPANLQVFGTPLEAIIRHNAMRGEYGLCDIESEVARRLDRFRTRQPYRLEWERPDGSVVEVIGTPLPDGGFVTTYMDDTRRHRAEQELRRSYDGLEQRVAERTADLQREIQVRTLTEAALRQSRERIKAITENLVEGVLVVNRSGYLTFVNASAKRLLGWEPASGDIEGLPIDQLVQLRTLAGSAVFDASPWRQVAEGGSTITEDDALFATPSGRILCVAYACSPLSEDGEQRAVIISFRDIGALKHAQRQVLQASRMASVGQLAAGIAHEINTPAQYIGDNLRFIGTSLPMLKSLVAAVNEATADPSPARDLDKVLARLKDVVIANELDYLTEELPVAAKEALEGIGQVSRIVLSMKEFSHPGTTTKTATDLNHAIETTLTVSRNTWKHSAEVETHFDQTLPMVLCHAGEINQVFLNLVVNAAQAIESSGKPLPGKIVISTHCDGDWAEVRVADNGNGVPESIREQIFDPFFTTKEVGKGTGQGLTICRDIVVAKHEGSIDIGGREGDGATFIIRLPVGIR